MWSWFKGSAVESYTLLGSLEVRLLFTIHVCWKVSVICYRELLVVHFIIAVVCSVPIFILYSLYE